MSRKKKEYVPRYPDDWEVSTSAQVNGRWLHAGVTEVKIRGERGRFVFLKAVKTRRAYWLDFVGGPEGKNGHKMWRSFAPDRVKRVHVDQRRRDAA